MGIGGFFKSIFGTSHDRMMRKLQPIVNQINELEDSVKVLSDDALRGQTAKFKEQIDNGRSLDDLLPEAFATVREASRRVLNMRHYDVQLIGGIVLHRGMIAEMKTGEGKTLVATSPMYLNALAGKGAHLVTVNDYLAGRDADWMGQIYKFLGLSVGKILTDMDNESRRKSYNCDITYGTNNEFGFDYLRDNMKYQLADYVQRGHFYAIVDEVDSILIDEARTPLIISGQLEQDLSMYKEINKLVPFLKRDEDYVVDEKAQSVALNESGIEKIEKHMGIDNIYDPKYIEHLHHVNKALQAHTLYKRDQNYVIENGKIVIIDDFTGRMMHGRRWSDGLHQAIEAKEGVEIQAESQTLATITFQNYFRMYEKLAGMTGTADTEAEEFKKIYKLDVVCIPTAKKIIRKDYQDVIYFNEKAKIDAIAAQIEECHKKGQPILVGTVSVEKSEVFSKAISKLGIEHNVLNAKNHKREAEIIAQAGRKGAVTIATNMAGRGTDILLGGNPEFMARQECGDEHAPNYAAVLAKYKEQCAKEKAEVYEAGGLFILGTERHESRRIDNQLRGRAGRQGDPGASRFFLSLDDDLLRIFGGEELKNRMAMFGMEKQADVPIEAGIVSRAVETAQKRVEGRNFDIRKNLLEYDDVMNAQRKSIYELRSEVLKGENLEDNVLNAFEDIVYTLADEYLQAELAPEDWNMDGMLKQLDGILGREIKIDVSRIGRGDRDARLKLIWDLIEKQYKEQCDEFNRVVKAFEDNLGDDSPYKGQTGTELLMELAQNYYLREIDHFWRAHLTTMTNLRESISLRGYAQKDPKQEYKREAYTLFEKMMTNIKKRMMTQLFRVKAEVPDFSRMKQAEREQMRAMQKAVASQNAAKVQADQNQVDELKAMASKPQNKSGSLSMAEIMALSQQGQKPAASQEQSGKALSMAEIMAMSKSEPRTEKPAEQKKLSMADMMPSFVRDAMNEINEERRRATERVEKETDQIREEAAMERQAEPETVEQKPQKALSMADLMPASMRSVMQEAADARRRAMKQLEEESQEVREEKAIKTEDEDRNDSDLSKEDREEIDRRLEENKRRLSMYADFDLSEKSLSASSPAESTDDKRPEPSTISDSKPDETVAKESTASTETKAETKKEDIFGSISSSFDSDMGGLSGLDDISLSSSSELSGLDSLNSKSDDNGFSLNDDLLGSLSNEKKDDTPVDDDDPFGIFKNLGI